MDRAIGIVRVSQRDRGAQSPVVQARGMLALAGREAVRLDPNDIWDENVDDEGKVHKAASGGWDLSERPRLRRAIELIESGQAQVLMAERFDRLTRGDLDMQRAIIRRVEDAGGRVLTVPGVISHATAETELHANLDGAISHYQKRTATERSWAAVEVAIEQGKIPWHQTPPGYRRTEQSTLVPDPQVAPVVQRAFQMRFDRRPNMEVRSFLAEHGIRRSYHGTCHLLRDRLYVGEIHFGTHTPNLAAHEAIVDRGVFDTVQRIKDTRGRKPKSERLLARLGILRCATCDSRMVVGTTRTGYYFYRCPPTGDCPRRTTISATMIEGLVIERVTALASGERGRAAGEVGAREARATLDRAQRVLDDAILAFAGLSQEPAAQRRLEELTAARDAARERADDADHNRTALDVYVHQDWDKLSLEARRDLIAALIARVTVAPGRGLGRVEILDRSTPGRTARQAGDVLHDPGCAAPQRTPRAAVPEARH